MSVALFGTNRPMQKYAGKEDSRDQWFGDFPSLIDFFLPEKVSRLEAPPRYFDERPVLMLRVRRLTRYHPYHVWNHFMTALGILRVMKEKRSQLGGAAVEPLMVFLNERENV